jgi:hypothetical protein
MDSKMDSGYLGPGENNAHALEDDYNTMRELAPEEVIGVMDELLCHEVSGLDTRLLGYIADGDCALVDGMAYGPPALPNPLYVPIPR